MPGDNIYLDDCEELFCDDEDFAEEFQRIFYNPDVFELMYSN